MSKFVVPITIGLLLACLLLSVGWLIHSPDFEPALAAFGLLVSLTGVYVDRVVSRKERRKSLLVVLIHELYMNLNIINDKAFSESENGNNKMMFPRLITSTISIVIASGEFNGDADKKLFKLMCGWLDYASIFNKKLDGIEIWILTKGGKQGAAEVHKSISVGLCGKTKEQLDGLVNLLLDKYGVESEIGADTKLFED